MQKRDPFTRVMVVDDEPVIRRLLATILTSFGYDVVSADGARQAKALLDEDPSVDLLLTDIAMPDGDGFELARDVRQRHPGLRVLFMSGHSGGNLESGIGALIHKPFRIEELLCQVACSLSPALSSCG